MPEERHGGKSVFYGKQAVHDRIVFLIIRSASCAFVRNSGFLNIKSSAAVQQRKISASGTSLNF
jgi:hypothetical protein